jgi:hypothetical protein
MRALALALALTACGGATIPQTRPVGEDPIALLPSGADAIFDVDVEQLRDWPETRRVLGFLPEEQRTFHLSAMEDVDALWAALYHVGSKEMTGTIVLRGRIDLEKIKTFFGATVQESDWHGVVVAEANGMAAAKLTGSLMAVGGPVEVRRAVDLSRGEGESVRARDKDLMSALSRAPTAKIGRPAVMAGTRPPDALRQEMRKADLPGSELIWIAVSLAVGDGFDIGVIAGAPSIKEAFDLAESGRNRVRDFASKGAVRALGLKPFLDPIILKARDLELHVAYRLPGYRVAQMFDRLESLSQMAKKKATP